MFSRTVPKGVVHDAIVVAVDEAVASTRRRTGIGGVPDRDDALKKDDASGGPESERSHRQS
jgi:hypothetical protein